ncbi:unnamed protein product [[Candida] boidinii]|nr:unnamed protein product [[Candida] boidinii]
MVMGGSLKIRNISAEGEGLGGGVGGASDESGGGGGGGGLLVFTLPIPELGIEEYCDDVTNDDFDCAGKPTGVWRYASELALDLELSDENEELLTFKCSGIGDTPDPDGVVVPDGVLAVVTEIPVGIGGAGARVFVVFVVVVFAVAVDVAVELEFNGVTAEADEIEADLDDLTLDCSLLLLLKLS